MALLQVFLPHGVVEYGNSTGDKRLQTNQLHLLPLFVFKVGDGGLEGRLNEAHVAVFADELAVGEQIRSELAGAQFADQICGADLETTFFVCLLAQDSLLHQVLTSPLLHEGQEAGRAAADAALRHLALHQLIDVRSVLIEEVSPPMWPQTPGSLTVAKTA